MLSEREQKMVELYKNGVYQTKITQLMHCKRETLLKTLTKAGVHILSKTERNRKVDFNPFNLNTEESNYWLGYLIADGNISKFESRITIVSKDLNHLKKFHLYCKNPNKINKKSNKDCYVSGFSSKEVKNYLLEIGIPPNKSFTVNPTIKLNWDIVRGVFDGDGCVSVLKNQTKIHSVFILTASEKFKEKLCDFLNNEHIEYTLNLKDNCYLVVIRRNSYLTFAMKMYNNANVFLERKYERFRPLLEQFNNENRMNSGKARQGNPELSLELNAL